MESTTSPIIQTTIDGPDDTRTRILRKGDLVRIKKIQDTRLKHRDGSLGKINRSGAIPQEKLAALPDDPVEQHPFFYDIDFVLGGKITKCHRRELVYTTAESEGMIGDNGRVKRKRKPSSVVLEAKEETGVKNKKKKGGQTKAGEAKAGETAPKKAAKSAAKKGAGGKRKAAGVAKPDSKKTKTVEPEPLDDDNIVAKDLFEKHKKDFERALTRLEKVDQFGFFFEAPLETKGAAIVTEPLEAVQSTGGSPHPIPQTAPTPVSDAVQSQINASISNPAPSSSSMILGAPEPVIVPSASTNSKAHTPLPVPSAPASDSISGPSAPAADSISGDGISSTVPPPNTPFAKIPLTWYDIRERNEACRYDLDRLSKLEKERKKRLGPYIWDRRKRRKQQELEGSKKVETWDLNEIPTNEASTKVIGKRSLTRNGIRVHPRVLHPKGIDWDLFRQDVVAMCDAAIAQDPQGCEGKSGTVGHAAKKIKDQLDQIYERTAKRHMEEMEFADSRHEFTVLLQASTNQEAAFQGEWRRMPFPERKYERITSDVICAGLTPFDQKSASQEKESALPDSFVGLSYTYNDTGQSEGWMKSVFQTANSKTKKKELSDEEKAANALAADDGVVRAQVRATMRTLLIGVQDKVMTDAGVLKQPELRSANWDASELQGRCSQVVEPSSPSPPFTTSLSESSEPDLVEQSVWGIDCYTRRNVLICVEKDLDAETAVEFLEKWLLPAINACPVDLAHDLTNAAKILEGLPLYSHGNISDMRLKSDKPQTGCNKSPSSKQNKGSGSQEEVSGVDGKEVWSHSLLGKALVHKISHLGPPWLKAAAFQLRRAIKALGHDFFRVHPKGHGSIVLSPKVKANSLVTFYRGEVYPSWRWGEKMDAIDMTQVHIGLRPNLPDFYNMALERPQADPQGYGLMIVDGSRKAGHGSMLSHSCDPTCEVRVAALRGHLCLAMTTLRDIEQGEELTFDYNAVTESLEEYQAAVCLCGNKKCRGSFLHFATADCYQRVLNRNAPIAVRFANLVMACTKKVMAEDDERTLNTHGFGTAAFGAVSFTRHLDTSASRTRRRLDSMENVPVWLRTYVADVLRYIEYERRALPIALLCDHFKTAKPKEEAQVKKSSSKPKKKEKEDKPENSFQFFVRKNTPAFLEDLGEEALAKMKGMEVQQNLRRVGSGAWKKLTDEEKLEWKERAIDEWKARKDTDKKDKADVKVDKQSSKGLTPMVDEVPNEKSASQGKDENLNLSRISFEAADAEGAGAMEQRIQQLTQALSRIGRLLDNHREIVTDSTQQLESRVEKQIHQPLSIMTDHEVVTWMWRSDTGIVKALLRSIKRERCVDPSLYNALVVVVKKYEGLDAFVDDPISSGIPTSQARTMLTEGLLGLRDCLHQGLQELAKELKRFELQRGRMRAKVRRDEAKESVRNEVKELLHDLISEVIIRFEGSGLHDTTGDTLTADYSNLLQVDAERPKIVEPALHPWLEHYSDRWKLEAAADILLMHARTTTFFKIIPYTALESTPVEVYARELGNVVPRAKIRNAQNAKIGKSTNIVLVDESRYDGLTCPDIKEMTKRKDENPVCDPDEVVAKVTVSYSGDYVVSQLLQWFNGGIGQKPGLPDMVGCVMLPSIESTWKSSTMAGGKAKKTTHYRSQLRPRLFDWLRDPRQRGSPFPEELGKVFQAAELLYSGDSLEMYPLGSPVLDFLVMGEDANINHTLAALDRERLRDVAADGVKDSATNRLESAVDEAMPAQAVARWVQCENPNCLKWRRLPFFIDIDVLPDVFYCKDNTWNPSAQSCDAPEDIWDENDTNVHNEGIAKDSDEHMLAREIETDAVELLDLANKYEIGERYDVHRTGKDFYCTGEVVDTDFKDGKNRVKMHFPKVPEKYDEWFELPSERIAPLNSKQLSKAEREKVKREAKKLSDKFPKSIDKAEEKEKTGEKDDEKDNSATRKLSNTTEIESKVKKTGKVSNVKVSEPSIVAVSLLALRHSTPTKNEATRQARLVCDDKLDDLFDTDSEEDDSNSYQVEKAQKPMEATSIKRKGDAKSPCANSKSELRILTPKCQGDAAALDLEPKAAPAASISIARKSNSGLEVSAGLADKATGCPTSVRIPRRSEASPAASQTLRIPRRPVEIVVGTSTSHTADHQASSNNRPTFVDAVRSTVCVSSSVHNHRDINSRLSSHFQVALGGSNPPISETSRSRGESEPRNHADDPSLASKRYVALRESRLSSQLCAQSSANHSRSGDRFRTVLNGQFEDDARSHDYQLSRSLAWQRQLNHGHHDRHECNNFGREFNSSRPYTAHGDPNGKRNRRELDTRGHEHHSSYPSHSFRPGNGYGDSADRSGQYDGGNRYHNVSRPRDGHGDQGHSHTQRENKPHATSNDCKHPLLGPRFSPKKK